MAAPNHETIVKAANAEFQRLQSLEKDLTFEINRLLDIEWERALTKQEADQVVDLRQAKAVVFGAMEELSFVTLRALDQSPEVERIRKALARVHEDLKKELDDVKNIGKIATTTATVLSGIDKIATKLEGVSKKLVGVK